MSTPGITGYPGGPYSTNSTKKYVPVVILDAILVPDLRKDTVLLSPRALFCLQGVKVYFNDELHLLLPNGSKVYLAETETAYMIELSDPISPPRRSILSANVDAGQRLERLEILFEHNGSSLQWSPKLPPTVSTLAACTLPINVSPPPQNTSPALTSPLSLVPPLSAMSATKPRRRSKQSLPRARAHILRARCRHVLWWQGLNRSSLSPVYTYDSKSRVSSLDKLRLAASQMRRSRP